MATLFLSLFTLAIVVIVGLRIYTVRMRSRLTASRKVQDVSGIMITLEIHDKRSLFILLAADGSINRLGTGTLNNTENGLFIGTTSPAMFEAVRLCVNDDMLQFLGREFEVKNPVGAPCKLKIIFRFKDDSSNGFVFRYGSESEGPPHEIADLVRTAVRETDPWYEQFKKAPAQKKPSA
jgi:hypothetical protein